MAMSSAFTSRRPKRGDLVADAAILAVEPDLERDAGHRVGDHLHVVGLSPPSGAAGARAASTRAFSVNATLAVKLLPTVIATLSAGRLQKAGLCQVTMVAATPAPPRTCWCRRRR
jgi:hypothetical protein